MQFCRADDGGTREREIHGPLPQALSDSIRDQAKKGEFRRFRIPEIEFDQADILPVARQGIRLDLGRHQDFPQGEIRHSQPLNHNHSEPMARNSWR